VVGSQPNRRPAFATDQYRKPYRGLRESVATSATHQPTHRARFYPQHLVLVLANSDVRIGELRGLAWSDVESRLDGQSVLMYVRGKTEKRRQVVPQPSVAKYLKRIRDYRENELRKSVSDDEPVLCSRDGLPVEN